MSAAQALYATPEEFEAASSWLIAIPAAAHLCNDTKLEVHQSSSHQAGLQLMHYVSLSFTDYSSTIRLLQVRECFQGKSTVKLIPYQRTQPRPSIFSPTPRAKFDAWATCTARYDALQDGRGRARGRYVEITRNIGWTGEGLDEEDEDVDLDDVVDESTQVNQGQGRRKAPAGMGPRMSMMIHEDGVGDPYAS